MANTAGHQPACLCPSKQGQNAKRVQVVNIFAVNECPVKSARDLCDQHIVKMPLESAQMVCTNLALLGLKHQYKPCFQNHPCTIWARQSSENLSWLLSHGLALCYTYTIRFGKMHKCQSVLQSASKTLHNAFLEGLVSFPTKGLTKFAQAMPDQFKCEDSVTAYRNYYKGAKLAFARWRYGGKPAWL